MASMQTKLRRKQRRKPSGLPFVQQRKASEYRLTTYKCDATGELPSKKFMRVPTTIGDLPSLNHGRPRASAKGLGIAAGRPPSMAAWQS